MFATINNNNEAASSLLAHKASVDIQENSHCWTALIYAAKKGHNEVVSTLLALKASVDLQDMDESAALMYATERGYTALVVLPLF